MNALARRNPTDKYPGYHGITKITILFRRKINQIPRYMDQFVVTIQPTGLFHNYELDNTMPLPARVQIKKK